MRSHREDAGISAKGSSDEAGGEPSTVSAQKHRTCTRAQLPRHPAVFGTNTDKKLSPGAKRLDRL